MAYRNCVLSDLSSLQAIMVKKLTSSLCLVSMENRIITDARFVPDFANTDQAAARPCVKRYKPGLFRLFLTLHRTSLNLWRQVFPAIFTIRLLRIYSELSSMNLIQQDSAHFPYKPSLLQTP